MTSYRGYTTVWKPCDEKKCRAPATHGDFCEDHKSQNGNYTGAKRVTTPRTATATFQGDDEESEDTGTHKPSICNRLFCRNKFNSKKTPKKSTKKTPKRSNKKASKKQVKKTPKKTKKSKSKRQGKSL